MPFTRMSQLCNCFSKADTNKTVVVGILLGQVRNLLVQLVQTSGGRCLGTVWRPTLSVIDSESLRKVVRKSQVVLVQKNLGWLTGVTDDGVKSGIRTQLMPLMRCCEMQARSEG